MSFSRSHQKEICIFPLELKTWVSLSLIALLKQYTLINFNLSWIIIFETESILTEYFFPSTLYIHYILQVGDRNLCKTRLALPEISVKWSSSVSRSHVAWVKKGKWSKTGPRVMVWLQNSLRHTSISVGYEEMWSKLVQR